MFGLDSRFAFNLRVGIYFLLIMALLALGIFTAREKTGLLEPKYPLKILFYSVKGLQIGASVKLAGLPVGYVKSITFSPRIEDYQVVVTAHINRSVQSRIRTDSQAFLESSSVIGEKYIEISLGSIEKPIVPSGGTILGKE